MIINEEVVEWAKSYKGLPFHSLLCDPPYHFISITKRMGKKESVPPKYGRDGAFGRIARGFMGQEWDGGDIAFNSETWKTFKNILYDGAFGMAFASSKGWHRIAVAIEDAGFIIHPTIFGWAYGSGLPKATRVDNRIDDSPEVWAGHRYGSQALKPALEPIIVFQKPYKGRPIENIVKSGAGTLNIEDSRIGEEIIPTNRWKDGAHPFGGGAGNEYETVEHKGRWPSNFILYDEGARKALGDKAKFYYSVQEQIDTSDPVHYLLKANVKEKEAGLIKHFPCIECGEINTKTHIDGRGKEMKCKRCSHPTVKPIELAKYLATLLLPPKEYAARRIFIPFAGVMSEAIGAKLAGWEDVTAVEMSKEYCNIGLARLKYWTSKK